MKGKHIIVLLIVAAALVGVAIQQQRGVTPRKPDIIGRKVLPDLDINAVTALKIEDASGTLTIERKDGLWSLAEKHHYPVKFETLRDALVALTDAKIRDAVTFTEAHREALGMAAVPATNGTPTLVTLSMGSAPATTLWLGQTAMRALPEEQASMWGPSTPEGRYISTDQGRTVQLTAATLDAFTANATSWMDTDLLNIGADLLRRIVITPPEGEPAVLSKPEGASEWQLEGLGENEQIVRFRLTTVQSAIAYLTLSDVAPADTDPATLGLENAGTFTAETTDGRTYRVQVGAVTGAGGGQFARFAVEYAPPTPPEPETTASSAAEGESGAVTNNADNVTTPVSSTPTQDPAIAAQVAEQQKRFSNWVYVISGPKAQALRTTRAELVEPKPAPTEEATSAAEDQSDISDQSDKSDPSDASTPADTTNQE